MGWWKCGGRRTGPTVTFTRPYGFIARHDMPKEMVRLHQMQPAMTAALARQRRATRMAIRADQRAALRTLRVDRAHYRTMQALARAQAAQARADEARERRARRMNIRAEHATLRQLHRGAHEAFREPTTNVIFKVKGHRVEFKYKPTTFISYGTTGEECIVINVQDAVNLSDYFYFAHELDYTATCSMKTSNHGIYLNAILQFIGNAFKRTFIRLSDAATKKLHHCEVPTSVFLMSGKPTFYERYGFTHVQPVEFQRALEDVRAKKVAGTTYQAMAADVLDACKTKNDPVTLDRLDSVFVQEMAKRDLSMTFEKRVTPIQAVITRQGTTLTVNL